MVSARDELDLIALLLFSAGSRTTFTQPGEQQKAELEDTNFSVCFVRW